MQYQELIGKITEYLHLSAAELSKWLGKKLPDVLGEDWWRDGVLGTLSGNQLDLVSSNNIDTLDALDLSALLRVANKNWYTILNRHYLRQSDRTVIQKMFTVRNNWAHAPSASPAINSIIEDLETLESFLGFVDVGRDKLREFERFLDDIKTNGVSSEISEKPQTKQSNVTIVDSGLAEIGINSFVCAISDRNVTGVVLGIDKVGDTNRYKVFIDGSTKEYFEDQIEFVKATDTLELSDISEVQRILTAHQIKKPSSDSLYSLNAARIDFVPYQFRPALKFIKSDTPRLLIADSVGVGKTIEAGLLLKELQARTSLDSVLIICPKPLVAERKWEVEMRRFDEDFTAADGNLMRHIMREVNRDGVWPEKYKRLIIPYSLFKEDLLYGQSKKRAGVPGLLNLNSAPFFDMVIVDEAHHARNTDTYTHQAVKYFCDNANAAVFLTATPLQLGNDDLFSLLNILFPDTVIDKASFYAMSEPNEYINEALRNLRVPNRTDEARQALKLISSTDWGSKIVARNPLYQNAIDTLSGSEPTREQRVKLIHDVESLHSFSNMITRTRRQDIEDFCVRRAYTVESIFTSRQRELHDELLIFVGTVMSMRHPTISLKFLMCTIRRQAASCIFGLAPFIKDIVTRGLEALDDDFDYQDLFGESSERYDDLGILAEKVISLAENLPEEDTKFDGLADIVVKQQNRANNKMIIFSTFRHTLRYLLRKIRNISNIRVAYVDGSIKEDERYALRERFAMPKENPQAIDILLFTEIGSEGLDYQFCDTMVNYDLPWNPMRIEQRIGRIDRRGQESDVAHIYNCITLDTIDQEIYERCMKRIGVFEHSIGDCSDILGKLAKSINDIIIDVTLTKEERELKLEQMADNEVRHVQELRRLEDEEKQMFGVDISGFIGDIDKADNPWISTEAIKRLVSGYLEERLGSDSARLTDKKIKLSQTEKEILVGDYRNLGNIRSDSIWSGFLKSSSKVCGISYSRDEAKNNKTLYLTPMHPLVRQAAGFYAKDKPLTTTIEVSTTDITAGTYPFQIYLWDYTGEKPQSRIVPVCSNDEVQRELASILQSALSTDSNIEGSKPEWEKLTEQHLSMWQDERNKYRTDCEASCRFKIESLIKSNEARKSIALRQINETGNEKIVQMRKSEIERLDSEFAVKKKRYEENAATADIHTMLLVNGVLVVRSAE